MPNAYCAYRAALSDVPARRDEDPREIRLRETRAESGRPPAFPREDARDRVRLLADLGSQDGARGRGHRARITRRHRIVRTRAQEAAAPHAAFSEAHPAPDGLPGPPAGAPDPARGPPRGRAARRRPRPRLRGPPPPHRRLAHPSGQRRHALLRRLEGVRRDARRDRCRARGDPSRGLHPQGRRGGPRLRGRPRKRPSGAGWPCASSRTRSARARRTARSGGSSPGTASPCGSTTRSSRFSGTSPTATTGRSSPWTGASRSRAA